LGGTKGCKVLVVGESVVKKGRQRMLWRVAIGVLLGLAVWWLLFFAVGIGIGLVWPDYREAARVMMQEQSFRLFALPLLLANYLLFAVAGVVAGRVSTAIDKTGKAALISAGLLLIYAGVQHYIRLWNQLPDWYNLTIPVVISVSVWLGGRVKTPSPNAT
jgi:hypothetical protein